LPFIWFVQLCSIKMDDVRLEAVREKTQDDIVSLNFADTKGLTVNEAEELKERETFDLFDKDGSGSISVDELGKVMRALGYDKTQRELQTIMEDYDIDKNGTISYEEYTGIIDKHKLSHVEVEIQLREAFLVFDRDKSGTLDRCELQEVLCEMGEPLSKKEVDYVLSKIDINQDGKIEVDEFVKFLLCKV